MDAMIWPNLVVGDVSILVKGDFAVFRINRNRSIGILREMIPLLDKTVQILGTL